MLVIVPIVLKPESREPVWSENSRAWRGKVRAEEVFFLFSQSLENDLPWFDQITESSELARAFYLPIVRKRAEKG